jgi:hypothetical protein
MAESLAIKTFYFTACSLLTFGQGADSYRLAEARFASEGSSGALSGCFWFSAGFALVCVRAFCDATPR